jgi:hypothetical protein
MRSPVITIVWSRSSWPFLTSMIVACVMTRELDVGKAFAVSAARIPSIMESNDQIILISVSHILSLRVATHLTAPHAQQQGLQLMMVNPPPFGTVRSSRNVPISVTCRRNERRAANLPQSRFSGTSRRPLRRAEFPSPQRHGRSFEKWSMLRACRRTFCRQPGSKPSNRTRRRCNGFLLNVPSPRIFHRWHGVWRNGQTYFRQPESRTNWKNEGICHHKMATKRDSTG